MNDKPKHVKVYDLNKNLLAEFSMYSEAAAFIGTTASTLTSASKRNSCVSKKYYVRSEGPRFIDNTLRINIFCKTCGIEICEKNKTTIKTKSKNYIANSCMSCVKNRKFCSLHYESKELEKLSIKRSKQLSKDKWKYYNKAKVISYKTVQKQKQKEVVTNLGDNYIKMLINREHDNFAYNKITPELINLKRKEVLIKRKLKTQGIWVR